eukprot:gb/GECG01001336.1/.p1 GENE.gb/GECG01001336.1/~~gb/GECG01001336.1/.p1  ORF type:complete len:517 (+),score=96.21 gb/GECG01001336.1/:1-1551(+)
MAAYRGAQYGTAEGIWSSIASYLQDKSSTAQDPEAANVALDCLREAFGADPEKWKEKYSLEDIFTAGLAALHGSHQHQSSTGVSMPPSDQSHASQEASAAIDENAGTPADSHSSHIESSRVFQQFLEKLKATGYFNNAPEGSPEYREKYAKAVDTFKNKMQHRTSGNGSGQTASASPSSGGGSSGYTTQADAEKDAGNNAMKAGNLNEAIRHYTEAIHLAPNGPNSHTYFANRAAAYTKTGDYEKAVQDSESTIDLKPDWPKGYNRLGTALFYLGRYSEAAEAYEKYLEQAPSDSTVQGYLEKARAQAGGQSANNQPGQQRPGAGGQQQMPQGMPDLSSMGGMEGLMNNPMVQQMTQQMMQNPEAMQNMMQSMFGGGGGADMQNMMQNMFGGGQGGAGGQGADMQNMMQNLFGGAGGGGGGGQGQPDMNNVMSQMQNMMGQQGRGGSQGQQDSSVADEVSNLLQGANLADLRYNTEYADIVSAYETEGPIGVQRFENDPALFQLHSDLKSQDRDGN